MGDNAEVILCAFTSTSEGRITSNRCRGRIFRLLDASEKGHHMTDEWRDSELTQDISAGQWIDKGLARFEKTSVGSIAPVGFDAYARVLHPVESVDEEGGERWLRWSDVARATGAITHAQMELITILKKAPKGFLRSTPPVPESIVLPWPDQLEIMARVLSRYTTAQDDCWFAFWEGNTAFDGINPYANKLRIGSHNYYIFRGSVSRATYTFHSLTPNMWWPADRAWFVVSHFDFPSTWVGGTAECITELLQTDEIEAWPANAQQTITSDSDHLN